QIEGVATDALGISLNNTDAGALNWQLLSIGSANTLGDDDYGSGSSLLAGSFVIRDDSSGSFNPFVIDPFGRVGIGGINRPVANLHVHGDAVIDNRNLGSGDTGLLLTANGTNHATANVLQIFSNWSSRLVVNAS